MSLRKLASLLAALLLALALGGCGSGDGSESDSGSSDSSESDDSGSSDGDDQDSGDSNEQQNSGQGGSDSQGAPQGQPPGGQQQPPGGQVAGVIRGDGYAFRAPAGWADATAEVKQGTPGIDTAVKAGRAENGFTANLNVVLKPQGSASIMDILGETGTGLEGMVTGGQTRQLGAVQVDGSTAYGIQTSGTHNENGLPIQWLVYVAEMNGRVYALTLTALQQDAGAQQALQAVQQSWTWY